MSFDTTQSTHDNAISIEHAVSFFSFVKMIPPWYMFYIQFMHKLIFENKKDYTSNESTVIAIQSIYFPPLALSKSGNGLK